MAKSRRKTPNRTLTDKLDGLDATKTKVAGLLGMTVEQLRHIEAGRRRPTLAQALAIEDVLSIPARSWI